MSRYRNDAGSDEEYSDQDNGRGHPAPKRSEREPNYDARKRPVPPPNRRQESDGDVLERRPPANRDTRERRPPSGRPSRDRSEDRERDGSHDRRERDNSRSVSRDRQADRNPREGRRSASRDRDMDDDNHLDRPDDRRHAPPTRSSREHDDGRGSRNNSRDRYQDDDDDRYDRVQESRDRNVRSSRDGLDRSRNNHYDDDDNDDHYDQVRGSRDRAVRSSREGDVRRSREAPKGFTPKSYARPDGKAPASAWNDNTSHGQHQYEKENDRPHDRGESWTSSGTVKHRPPPSSRRNNHRNNEWSDEDDDIRGNYSTTRMNDRENGMDTRRDQRWRDPKYDDSVRHNSRGNRDRDDSHYARDNGHGRSSRDGGRDSGRGRARDEEFDLEESQDNNITPFSEEKPKKKEVPPRRQLSPDNAIARRLDSEDERLSSRGRRRDDSRERGPGYHENDHDQWHEEDYDHDQREYRGRRDNYDDHEHGERNDDYNYRSQRGGRYEEDDRYANRGGDRKWESGNVESGISNNDMQRLDNFRKSGRYGGNGDESEKAIRGSYNFKPSGNVPMVFYCPPNGGNTDLFQCYIVRERNGISSKLYPTYKLYSQDGEKLLILARKMSMNSTSNYHLFDMTRGIPEKTNLTKKSGNYIGKLRGIDTNHAEYVLVTKSEDKHEVAAIQFDRLGLVSQLKEGCQPRKMNILLPTINKDNEPIPHKLKHTDTSKKKPKSMATMLRRNDFGNMYNLVSKDPIYENGNYRLNFHGRVSIPSVKNFQLTTPDDIDDVVCQFGKIADETFNLDFKYPLNPFQAFSLALCHFDS